jgi:hypothetical protein
MANVTYSQSSPYYLTKVYKNIMNPGIRLTEGRQRGRHVPRNHGT